MGLITRTAFNNLIWTLRYKDLMARMSNLPGVKQLGTRVIDVKTTNLSYIPIHADIELPVGTVAPAGIIEHFINEAAHHVIINRCPCRTALRCESFEADFGCSFIGQGAREIDPELGRHVTREEALEHLSQACDMGLISVIGKFKGDAIALGVRDHSRLMTICHCCPCCCVSTSLHLATREARDMMVRLEGCGECVEACIFKQILVEGDRAVIGEECKGCGRCAAVCGSSAIRLKVEDATYIDECIDRISATVDVS
jgi:hypothetical protein